MRKKALRQTELPHLNLKGYATAPPLTLYFQQQSLIIRQTIFIPLIPLAAVLGKIAFLILSKKMESTDKYNFYQQSSYF